MSGKAAEIAGAGCPKKDYPDYPERDTQRDAMSGSATITDVALRYGFEHLGRFAGAYREAFGELPSETLGRLHGSGATHTLR